MHISYLVAAGCFAVFAFLALRLKSVLKSQGLNFDEQIGEAINKNLSICQKQLQPQLPWKHLAIGIDIGGTGTKFGIVDRVGNVLFTGDLSTKKHKKIETFIDELHDKLSALIQNCGWIRKDPGNRRGCTQWKFLYRYG